MRALHGMGIIGNSFEDEMYLYNWPEFERMGLHAKEVTAESSPSSDPPHRRRGYVYLLAHKSEPGVYKIGRTRNPESRRQTFGVLLPFPVEFECVIPARDMVVLESSLHAKFAADRINGEWFRLSPADVAYIKSLDGAV